MIKDATNANEEVTEEAPKKTTRKKESKPSKEVSELKELLSSKTEEIAELNDKYLRLLAEYDNYRKS